MIIEHEILINRAREEAKRYHHRYIRTEHILLALLEFADESTRNRWGIDRDCIRQRVAFMPCPTCSAEEKMELSASASRAFTLAQNLADGLVLTLDNWLSGILQSSLTVQNSLSACGNDIHALHDQLNRAVRHGE